MLTVMVVDDDPLLCTAMRRKIEMIDRENQLGIQETLIAHSAQEAWGILQEKSVDILISDIRMPYQTGLELADKVNEAFPEIQVVILSGHDDYEYMRSALRSGVVDYLLKPVKLVQIQEVLLKCQENLRRRKAQSLRNGNDREALENWLNGLLAGKTGKPPVEFPHPVFWVAWPFGGEGEDGFRAEEVFAEESSENVAAFFFRNVTQDAVVLLNTESSREDIVKAYIETCQESCVRQGAGRPCFAVSRPFTRLEEYPVFYKEARYTMAYRMLEPFDLRFSSAQAATEQSRLSGFKPGFIRPFRAEILLSFISCFKKSSVGNFFRSSPFLRRFDDFMCIGSLRFRRWLLRIIWNWKRFPTLADLPV